MSVILPYGHFYIQIMDLISISDYTKIYQTIQKWIRYNMRQQTKKTDIIRPFLFALEHYIQNKKKANLTN